jgi:GxxExxY protein
MTQEMKHKDITNKVIRAFYNVHNVLGYGFLEKCYERAMMIEFEKMGLNAETQFAIKVFYDGKEIGDYKADIIVENKVILELKTAKVISEEHLAQLLNYLRATQIEVGMLLNFGTEAQFARRSFDNERKTTLSQESLPVL